MCEHLSIKWDNTHLLLRSKISALPAFKTIFLILGKIKKTSVYRSCSNINNKAVIHKHIINAVIFRARVVIYK